MSTQTQTAQWPSPEHLQLIQFEGCTVAVIPPEDYEDLFEHARRLGELLAAERLRREHVEGICETYRAKASQEHQRRLYWQGVVRGARAELSAQGRLTPEEYTTLCADTEARDYVDEMDRLREQLEQANKRIAELEHKGTATEARLKRMTDAATHSKDMFSGAVSLLVKHGVQVGSQDLIEAAKRQSGGPA